MRVGDTLTDHEGVLWVVVDTIPGLDDGECIVLRTAQKIREEADQLSEADVYRSAT